MTQCLKTRDYEPTHRASTAVDARQADANPQAIILGGAAC